VHNPVDAPPACTSPPLHTPVTMCAPAPCPPLLHTLSPPPRPPSPPPPSPPPLTSPPA
jgi:hypothetical protein